MDVSRPDALVRDELARLCLLLLDVPPAEGDAVDRLAEVVAGTS